ncbi:hypothetical protein GCM10023213_41630 [Prosthecobacter algae]|uniref:Uncharacterized protein n=1 Tax=Prosthecobacter algae TaxID=1144682 RepID=A0ABP9PNN3_9BACT
MALSRKWFWLFLALFALVAEASALADQGKQATLPELVTEVLDTLSQEQEIGTEGMAVDFSAFDVPSFRQGMCLGQALQVWPGKGDERIRGARLHRWLCIDLR